MANQFTAWIWLFISFGLLLGSCAVTAPPLPPQPEVNTVEATNSRFDVLVFSKTAGFRHESIPDGIQALERMGEMYAFNVKSTEDARFFSEDVLAEFEAVVFLNTTLDVLDDQQQRAFESFIQQGGGFVGIHAAADTEYDWEWYGGLVGAYFESHPDRQTAEVQFIDRQNAFAEGLPFRFDHYDEWYNYKTNPRGDVHVLAVVDEGSYEGGEMGHDHPIAWAHEYDGGRSFYTGLGHTSESYSDETFLTHLRMGIEWAAGESDADVTATISSAFNEVVLTGELTDPMELDVTTNGRVFIIEWAGVVKIWEPDTGKMRVVGWIPVDKEIEDGLLGLALDPNFDDNGWMYIYYSPVQDEETFNRLSRFTYDGEMIDMGSEVIMLEIPVQRLVCCHSAGSVQFDAQGNLYLSTGDNSGGQRDNPDETYRRFADQGRTTSNTNDLRGKILRIRPQPDGSYTIPEGNLFEQDELHRGEIFTMGHRNPFRYSIDNETGWIYWGDVGPGAGGGFDEFNQAREPGFFGWPLFTGYNVPFDMYYFNGADSMSQYMDPAAPINASPYNTGARELPPAQPAMIPYLYGMSDDFPELGAGGMNPMAGPVFHYDAATASELAIPPYYNGKVLIYEWMRNWVQVVTLDENGDLLKLDPFLPRFDFIRPIDIEVAPDGRLYVLEWGDEFWGSNQNAQLVRIDYHGNSPERPQVAKNEEEKEGPLAITWPPDGAFFEIGQPVEYNVQLHDEALSDQVSIHTYTGFDTSPIKLKSLAGLEGTFTIDSSYTQSPDVNYMNRFAQLEACLALPDGSNWCDAVRLHPRVKQAEHVYDKTKSRRRTYSARPASEHWGSTVLSVMQLGGGATLTYNPVNFVNIESMTLRFRTEDTGRVEFYTGVAEQEPFVSVELSPESGDLVTPHQAEYLAGLPEDAPGLAQLVEGAYDNWREITVPVNAPSGTNALVLKVKHESASHFLEIDWIRFNGDGVILTE